MVEAIRPRSVNAGGNGKRRFEERIKAAANGKWPEDRGLLADHLYARITHVCGSAKHDLVDVDNISKRILDALTNVVIADDKYVGQCLLTRAHVDWKGLDLSFIDDPGIISQVAALSSSDDVLIVEIGLLPAGQPPVRSGPIEAKS